MKMWDFERDADLRGFWVDDLLKMQKVYLKAMSHRDSNKLFIPDSLLRELDLARKKRWHPGDNGYMPYLGN